MTVARPSARALVAIGGVLAAALVVVLGVAMSRGVGDSPLGRTAAGFDRATPFELPHLDGSGRFVLDDHADGPLFIYFWASWCPPCREEAPLIQRLWPEYERRGYTFVGINILDAESAARAFVDEHDLTFPMLRDVEGEVYLEYGVYGLPEAFFIRPGLGVSDKFNGALKEADFRKMLDRLQETS